MPIFTPADILLPRAGVDLSKWAVVACDQFTSQPEYWRAVRETVGGAPSSLRLILPEAELGRDDDARARAIDAEMTRCLERGVLDEHPGCMVYVERTLTDGRVRRGLVGAVDLEAYDYRPGSASPVRASERTVAERIPPRVRIRRGAPLELPHVLLLMDDAGDAVLGPVEREKDALPLLYDFELMLGGGRLRGRLVAGEALTALMARIEAYERGAAPVAYAVGDGNHSLAAAKACYEEQKENLSAEEAAALPARYALVELGNLRDEAQAFEPIHRLIRTERPEALLARIERELCAPSGAPLGWQIGGKSGELRLNAALGPLAVGVLQPFLDAYAGSVPCEFDYIHGEDALRELASREGALGLLLPAVDKAGLFPGIARDGVLPRKSFSMGRAVEKRYYLEARRIR